MTDLLVKWFIKDADQTENSRVRGRYGVLSSVVGMVCNIFLFTVKFVLGSLSRSIAVTADAFNNLSDVGSSLVTLVGFKMASKPADRDHPFGHGRIEYLSGLLISLFIMLVGVEIGKTSLDKILNPEPVQFSIIVVAGLLVSIAVKLWMGAFNKRLGRRIGSAAMEATAVDSISDVCATGVTLVSVVAARFTTLPIDGVMGLIVAVLILYAGYGVAKDTIDPLLGVKPDPDLVKKIGDMVRAYDGILGIHDLIVHDYGPSRRFASVHAEVSVHSDILASHDIIDRAEREIAEKLNVEVVIHLDPIETDCEKTNELRILTRRLVQEIDPSFTIHDFRAVYGGALTNFIFDVNVPVETEQSSAEIKELIAGKLKEINPNYYAVVTVDRGYC